MHRTGATQLVREYLSRQAGKPFRVREVSDPLELTYGVVRKVLGRMLKIGEVERITPGVFRYVGIQAKPARSPVEARVCKAMHLRGSFSAREIGMLTDLSLVHVRFCARVLVENGDLEITCRQKTINGGCERVYRVRHRDNFYVKYVRGGELQKK